MKGMLIAILIAPLGCGHMYFPEDEDDADSNLGNTDDVRIRFDAPGSTQKGEWSLSSLPHFNTVMSAETNSLTSKAVSSTALSFAALKTSDIRKYFFADMLDEGLADDELFSEAIAKCDVMDKNARAFATLETATSSLCWLQDAPEKGVFIDHLENLADQTKLFTQEEETKLIKIDMDNRTFGLVQVKGSDESSNLYDATIVMCKSNTQQASGFHHILITSQGDVTYAGRTSSQDISLHANIEADEWGTYRFSHSKAKTIIIKESTPSNVHNMQFVLSETQEELFVSAEKDLGSAGLLSTKLYSLFDYEGKKTADAHLVDGGAALSLTLEDESGEILLQKNPVVGVEYSSSATPRYASEYMSDLFELAEVASSSLTNEVSSSLDPSVSFDYGFIDLPENDIESVLHAQGISCSDDPDYHVTFDTQHPVNRSVTDACDPTVKYRNICDAAWDKVEAIADEAD